MQKLDIKDNDIIVLRHPYALSRNCSEHLRSIVTDIIKDAGFNVKAIVLEEGMDIGVLRKDSNVNVKAAIKEEIQKQIEEDEERILYGDPNGIKPIGILHAEDLK